jgi:hypothetical protein
MAAARLFQTTDVEEQWHAVISPWLRAQAKSAWRDPRPTVILIPGRAESFYLRSRLVEEKVSFLGLRFWTPTDARTFLLGQIPLDVQPVSEADLHLLARASAEKLAAENSGEATLTSVIREPQPFLRAYDLLLGAGWDPAREGAVYGRKLAAELTSALARNHVATQSQLHRLLWQKCVKGKQPFFPRLLVSGFNATHWPLWDLLRAVISCAEETTLSLLAPRGFGDILDQLWIGSWEEHLGASAEIPFYLEIETKAPFEKWIASYEAGTIADAASCDFSFLATPDLDTQVQAVVLQALAYLKDEPCRRLGIIFSEENALSLGVADALRRLEIPLDDGTSFLQPGRFERRVWQSWLAVQEEPSVGRLIEWLRACEVAGAELGLPVGVREMAETLEDAVGETLVDDLDFLALHLDEVSSRTHAKPVARFLRSRVQLPENAAFTDFFALTQQAVSGWMPLDEIEPPSWTRQTDPPISRRTFLEWLKDSTNSQERAPGADSNHFYGKVHLLIYAQMPGQTWTHLILTGLNEGRWPRLYEAGAFGSRYELTELNRQARSLNRRGTGEGSQGVGHESVRPDRGYCLLPLERQDLAVRDLCAAVESTTEAVCFAGLTGEAGRALLPSDFFASAYQAKTGRPLDEKEFAALAKSTIHWCADHAPLLSAPEENKILSVDTAVAFAARRDPSQPFGRYEFAFAEPPSEPIQFACKTWEDAWTDPASVWLERIVGVAPWPAGELAWPRAVGTWVHRWLAAALNESREDGGFLLRLRAIVDREPIRMKAMAARADVTLYPWWEHVWQQARSIALALGRDLAPLLAERLVHSEYRLAKSRVALPGTDQSDFELGGRIDLLLVEPGAIPFDPVKFPFSDCGCWVIDFKTGAARRMSARSLDNGMGLQAMLYALAIKAAGARSVAVSLQTYDSALKPQVQIEQIEANVQLFRSLDRLHRLGIFGQRPEAESDYGFSRQVPMATRPIPAGILEAKWALTHGAGSGFFEESL